MRPSVRAARLAGAVSAVVLAATGLTTAAPLASGSTTPAATSAADAVPYAPVSRVAGADRYEVASNAAGTVLAPGIRQAFVASGEGYADALAAGAPAARAGAPVFLTRKGSLPEATRAAIETYRPTVITVLGGPNSVSDEVVSSLAVPSGAAVTRIGGSDRYAVAAAVAKDSAYPKNGVVYVASGQTYSDALSATAAAGAQDAPVLLVTASSVPTATRQALSDLVPSKVVVVGGPATISESVVTTIKGYTLGANVTRVAGADRYAVSAALSERTFEKGARVVYLASGQVFPDALAAGPLAGLQHGPVLLTRKDALPDVVRAEIARLQPRRIVLLGGPASVSDAVLGGLDDLTLAAKATDVSLGAGFACSVTGGAVDCWGAGASDGQLGTGALTSTFAPVPVDLPVDVTDVTASGTTACALDTEGVVRCWGRELGTTSTTPATKAGLPEVGVVDAGPSAVCAGAADTGVWCWGSNQGGLLGAPGPGRATPGAVPGISAHVTDVSVGTQHACAVTGTGDVWCWGWNGSGQVGVDPASNAALAPTRVTTLPGPVADVEAAGNRTCAVLTAGGVRCWGQAPLGDGSFKDSAVPVTPTGLGTTAGTLARSNTGFQCLAHGGVTCWGQSPQQQRTFGTDTARLAVADAICAVSTTDRLRCQGSTTQSGNPANSAWQAPVPVTGY